MTVIMIVTVVAAAAAILASCVSVAIGLVAIWLVTNFYRNSMELNVRTRESLKDMETAVARLEGLLGGRYSPPPLRTITRPLSTPAPDAPAASVDAAPPAAVAAMNDQQRSALKAEIQNQVTATIKGNKVKDAKAASLNEQIGGILDQFISSSKELVEEIKDGTDTE